MEVIFRKIESRTEEILKKLESNLDHYVAVHFHLSNLAKENKSLYQNKIAVNIIHEFLSSYNGWILHFMDNDLVIIAENMSNTQLLENVSKKIRDIFADDKLAYFSNKIANPSFCTIYEFPFNYNAFKKSITAKITHAVDTKFSFDSILQEAGENIQKFTAKDLSIIERDLATADINNIIRKQPICGIYSGTQKIKPFFHEIYISLDRLKRLFSYDVDFNTNQYLLKALNNMVNKILIEFLLHDSRILLGGPISINVTPEIIMSDLFSKFNKLAQDKLTSAVILEIDASEVLLDSQAFYRSVIYAAELGYKICLDGINEVNLCLLNREVLKVDFGKFYCKNELYNISDPGMLFAMSNAVHSFGANKLIMTECSTERVLSFGKQLEINLFQGLECDRLIKERNVEVAY
jgi:hypothetical protein